MELKWLTEDASGVVLTIKAVPRASANAIASTDGEWLRIRLKAPPADGKANAALILFLSELTGIPSRDIKILSGAGARVKRLRLTGATARRITDKLDIG